MSDGGGGERFGCRTRGIRLPRQAPIIAKPRSPILTISATVCTQTQLLRCQTLHGSGVGHNMISKLLNYPLLLLHPSCSRGPSSLNTSGGALTRAANPAKVTRRAGLLRRLCMPRMSCFARSFQTLSTCMLGLDSPYAASTINRTSPGGRTGAYSLWKVLSLNTLPRDSPNPPTWGVPCCFSHTLSARSLSAFTGSADSFLYRLHAGSGFPPPRCEHTSRNNVVRTAKMLPPEELAPIGGPPHRPSLKTMP